MGAKTEFTLMSWLQIVDFETLITPAILAPKCTSYISRGVSRAAFKAIQYWY